MRGTGHVGRRATGSAMRPFRVARRVAGFERTPPRRFFSEEAASPKTTFDELPRVRLKKPTKRAGRIMIHLDQEKRDEIVRKREEEGLEFTYDFRSGDAVEVKVQDPDEASPQIYKGVVIAKRNKGMGSNFVILNQIDEGERIELVIPTYAPVVKGIKVLQKAFIHKGKKRVRRSKLYYLRDRNPAEFTVL